MLSEQLNLFGDRPQAPKPPAQVKHETPAKAANETKADIVEKALAAVIMPAAEESAFGNEIEPVEVLANEEAGAEVDLQEAAEDAINKAEEIVGQAVQEIEPLDEEDEAEKQLPPGAEIAQPDALENESPEGQATIDINDGDKMEPASIEPEALETPLMELPEVVEQEPEMEEVTAQMDTEKATAEPRLEEEVAQEDHPMAVGVEPAEVAVEIDARQGELNIPPDHELFQRQYYTMRETTAMFGLTHAQLRSWENEFDVLQPRKNRKGDRYFRPVDIKNLELIYHLLRKRKFTPDGAKAYLKNNKNALDNFSLIQKMEAIRSFLVELKANL